jgi:SAM-dependent methyltransferase
MNRLLVEWGFRRRAPWTTRFTIDARAYGGDIDFASDARLHEFWAAFPNARSVLDLGALEGGHAVELARRADRVVAVEGRAANVDRARFACKALGVRNVEVVQADVEVVGPDAFGTFDAVFCSALLYHLARPMAVVERLRATGPAVYVWTHVAPGDGASTTAHGVDGTPGAWHAEPPDDDTVGLGPRSFWPTLDALVAVLRANGFPDVDVTEHDHPGGPAATVIARAEAR